MKTKTSTAVTLDNAVTTFTRAFVVEGTYGDTTKNSGKDVYLKAAISYLKSLGFNNPSKNSGGPAVPGEVTASSKGIKCSIVVDEFRGKPNFIIHHSHQNIWLDIHPEDHMINILKSHGVL